MDSKWRFSIEMEMEMGINMSIDMNMDVFVKYAPAIYFDRQEPFFPVRIGCTRLNSPGASPSFNRTITFDTEQVEFALEYAIYWHFDIGHLYDLEHIWVYVGKDGRVVDCEGSFHGKYLKGMLKDRTNIEEETHVRLYSQPGKHAFLPRIDFFELIPNLMEAAWDCAGEDGLIITDVAKGRYTTNDEINEMVKGYLQKFKFKPSMIYERYELPPEIFTSWEELSNEIPNMIQEKLEEIRLER